MAKPGRGVPTMWDLPRGGKRLRILALASVCAGLVEPAIPAAQGTATQSPTPGPQTQAVNGHEYQKIWYVSERTGSDTSDGTRAHPWRTVVHALETARAGGETRQAILVAEGIYAEYTLFLRPSV